MTSSTSSSPAAALAVASRMIFFSAALRFGTSDARSRTKRARVAVQSCSANCSNRRSWEAIFGPVMMKPAGILSLYVAS